MLRTVSKQSGESVQSVLKKKIRLRWERFTEKEGFKPGVSELTLLSQSVGDLTSRRVDWWASGIVVSATWRVDEMSVKRFMLRLELGLSRSASTAVKLERPDVGADFSSSFLLQFLPFVPFLPLLFPSHF